MSATAVALQLHGATDSSNLNLKIGQTFAGTCSSLRAARKKMFVRTCVHVLLCYLTFFFKFTGHLSIHICTVRDISLQILLNNLSELYQCVPLHFRFNELTVLLSVSTVLTKMNLQKFPCEMKPIPHEKVVSPNIFSKSAFIHTCRIELLLPSSYTFLFSCLKCIFIYNILNDMVCPIPVSLSVFECPD